MGRMTRRAAIRLTVAGGGLIGLGATGDYLLRRLFGSSQPHMGASNRVPVGAGPQSAGMMGSATTADMSTYMDLFNRHTELRRTVEVIPGGVRTTTESDSPELIAQLQAHVSSMYAHLERGAEVTCMSQSLPTLFRNASGYRRRLTLTAKGVAVTEISTNIGLTRAIRAHAHEVTGFVRDGMPAMMRGMMGA
jgi:hypothetical protein